MPDPLLRVNDLHTYFVGGKQTIKAVDGISFTLDRNQTVGVVGESGCGKSVTARSILRLIPQPPGKITGSILFEGEDLLKKSEKKMRQIRGNQIAMIFQEPMSSLNPVFTVGDQIMEAIRLHQKKDRRSALQAAIDVLQEVGIPLPEQRVHQYPHQMSGGMIQRVMIAMALSCNPKLLIADEPTTALDVTIQAQMLKLIKAIRSRMATSIMLITHDLGVVAEMCDKIIVMYAGKVAEVAPNRALFKNPRHPYTLGLLQSIPKLSESRSRLIAIEGTVPDPNDRLRGCSFHPRCQFATKRCQLEEPDPTAVDTDAKVWCWNHERLFDGEFRLVE